MSGKTVIAKEIFDVDHSKNAESVFGSSRRGDGSEVGAGIATEDRAVARRMDRSDTKVGTADGERTPGVVEERAQAGVKFGGMDCGAPRRQRHGGRLAGRLSENCGRMGGGAIFRSARCLESVV